MVTVSGLFFVGIGVQVKVFVLLCCCAWRVVGRYSSGSFMVGAGGRASDINHSVTPLAAMQHAETRDIQNQNFWWCHWRGVSPIMTHDGSPPRRGPRRPST